MGRQDGGKKGPSHKRRIKSKQNFSGTDDSADGILGTVVQGGLSCDVITKKMDITQNSNGPFYDASFPIYMIDGVQHFLDILYSKPSLSFQGSSEPLGSFRVFERITPGSIVEQSDHDKVAYQRIIGQSSRYGQSQSNLCSQMSNTVRAFVDGKWIISHYSPVTKTWTPRIDFHRNVYYYITDRHGVVKDDRSDNVIKLVKAPTALKFVPRSKLRDREQAIQGNSSQSEQDDDESDLGLKEIQIGESKIGITDNPVSSQSPSNSMVQESGVDNDQNVVQIGQFKVDLVDKSVLSHNTSGSAAQGTRADNSHDPGSTGSDSNSVYLVAPLYPPNKQELQDGIRKAVSDGGGSSSSDSDPPLSQTNVEV